MIEAVCLQANKLYRLWIARNPDFEAHGRVHIIGHSLGSALVAHILSNQPTKMPPLSHLPKQVITKTRDRFLFNTSDFFLCGSPLGIFLHLDQTQLMPRKGRERTMQSPQDEAVGHWSISFLRPLAARPERQVWLHGCRLVSACRSFA